MKLRYKVSEEIYIEMLEMQIKRKNRSPLSLIIGFISTIGQLGLLLYMIFSGAVTGTSIIPMVAMSAVILAMSGWYFTATKQRAKVTLRNFKYAKKIPEDFWQMHDLSFDETLTVRFGTLKSKYNLGSITGYGELDSAFIIYSGRTVVDIVPYTAVPDKQEFIDTINNAKHERMEKAQEEFRTSAPEEYKYKFNYAYTLDTYVKQQQEAYRRMYTTTLAYKFSFFMRLLITLYAFGYMVQNPIWYVIVGGVSLIVLMNLQHIVTFSPLSAMTIKSGIKSLAEEHPDPATTAYITTDAVMIRGSKQAFDIPFSDIKASRKISGGVALYLNGRTVMTIPMPKDETRTEFNTFVKFLSYKSN